EALEPGAEVGRAAPELDDVLAGDVRDDPDLALGLRPLAPRDLVLRPRALGLGVGVLRVAARPALAVDRDVVGLSHRTRARARAAPTPASPSRARGCPASTAQGRRESIPAPSRQDSSRPSSCGRSRSRLRLPAQARAWERR